MAGGSAIHPNDGAGVRMNASRRVMGEYGSRDLRLMARGCGNAKIVADRVHIFDRDLAISCASHGSKNAYPCIIFDNRIPDMEPASRSSHVAYSILRMLGDYDVLNVHGGGRQNIDAIYARPYTGRGTVNGNAPQSSGFESIGSTGNIDIDAVGSGTEYRSERTSAIDSDRFRYSDCPVAGRIEAVDFAVGGGLRDGPCKGFAWRRAATRIDVVAYAGDPGAGRLGVSGCRS